ncbi:hypothetical protein MAMP_00287 [Methylophaga aminisulfidivorans MP]|uniref:FCP1 homology domain-containing protein n=1 Tax=Methylophaga aminisulfidivorans MP TaxID=1026882 RepID=F5T1J0_9GAMM|nr:NIF family HAD-type phosphatase [Methylophaga aminisulfidivorans]EGL53086.1 hypothetical protein MAMP_00287 [Methylophaga aminisulfidivorans MP]
MEDLTLALDLEGVLITNAYTQLPRPGLMSFLVECVSIFGQNNLCIFTRVEEQLFRQIAHKLRDDNKVPDWFPDIRYIDWVGEHKDLRFVDDDIDRVIIIDDYPPYIKQSQKHRLIPIKQYTDPYSHESPDDTDDELSFVLKKLLNYIQ